MGSGETKFVPDFDFIYSTLCGTIDTMVSSVFETTRVEHKLFQQVDQIEVKYLHSIELDASVIREDILDDARERLKNIVQLNSQGPEK